MICHDLQVSVDFSKSLGLNVEQSTSANQNLKLVFPFRSVLLQILNFRSTFDPRSKFEFAIFCRQPRMVDSKNGLDRASILPCQGKTVFHQFASGAWVPEADPSMDLSKKNFSSCLDMLRDFLSSVKHRRFH